MRGTRLVVLTAAALAATAAPAAAQVPVAVAEERFDIDGDGKLDVVRVGEDATVTVMITGAAGEPPWKAFRTTGVRVRRAELDVRRIGKQTVILATAEFGRKRSRAPETTEVMALTWKRGALEQSSLETIGPQGRDGEWSVHVELTNQGLLRYQSRPGFARCDGKSYLFAELDDLRGKGPRHVAPPVALPKNATELRASEQPPPGADQDPRAVAFRLVAASTDAQAESAADLAPPRELEDRDDATSWSGFTAAGHYVTARQRSDYDVVALRVVARNVDELGVLVGERAYRVELPNNRGARPVWVRFDPPVAGRCVSVIVSKLRRGADLRELAVLTELELSGTSAAARLAQRLVEGGAAAATAREQLRELGAAGATAITTAARSTDDPRALRRLHDSLADLAARGVPLTDNGVDELARGFAAPHLSATQRALYRRAFALVGARAVAPLSALLADESASRTAREAAAAALAEQPDLTAQRALIAATGGGPRWLRRRIARALADREPRELAALLEAARGATAAPAEADLWRAVGDMARRAPAATAGVAAMTARLASTGPSDYELRYRLLAALGELPSPAAVEAVRRALPKDDDARSIALRRVAVGALVRNDAGEAGPLLANAVDDPDPGVRLLAIEGAATRTDSAVADASLLARLTGDRWPRVRRAAAGALAPRCRNTGVADAMYSALDDEDFGVQTTVLAGLSACGEPRIGSVLVEVARDKKRTPALRVQAIRLLGERGDRKLCPLLLDVVRAARREAWSSESALAVAAAGLGAVAASCAGDDDSMTALLKAAQDDAFPDVQIAAIHGIGRACPAGAERVLQRAAKLDHRGVREAATRALARCKRRP